MIGSPETLAAANIRIPRRRHKGRALWIAVDGEPAGMIVLHDRVAAEMSGLGEALRSLGVNRVVVATGDHEESEARRIAELTGADDFHYNCKPEDKADLVRQFQSTGRVAMVGDRVNDAPALAAADVGIAIGGHKNVALAIHSADIVILGDDAGDVLKILEISQRMADITRQNTTWAISFNALGLGLVTFGLLNPVLAAFLHHISSVFVVANAARLYTGADEIGQPASWVRNISAWAKAKF
jgi:Cu+-exporting ATPase